MKQAVQEPGGCAAIRLQRRDYFLGNWLRHVQTSPFYFRLFRPQLVRYERLVHPVTLVAGTVGRIDGYLDHLPFSKSMSRWPTRQIFYSSSEGAVLPTTGATAAEVPAFVFCQTRISRRPCRARRARPRDAAIPLMST
jgi:hypothetical protein